MHALFDTLRCFKGIGRELSIKGQKLKKYCLKVCRRFIRVDKRTRNIARILTDCELTAGQIFLKLTFFERLSNCP